MRICTGLLCDRTADVWMRGKAWCVPCSIKRFGFTTSAPCVAEAVAPAAAPDRWAGVLDTAPVPGPLFRDELLDLLERDGWHDAEIDWFTRTGGTLPELERFLVAHLNEGIEP
jgi:hypothetical protein